MNFGEDNENDSDDSGDDPTDPDIVPVEEDLSVSSNEKSPIPQPRSKTHNKPSNKKPAAQKKAVTKKPLPLKSTPPISPHKLPPPAKRALSKRGGDASVNDNEEVLLSMLKKHCPNKCVS